MQAETDISKESPQKPNGGRNLIVLGISAVLIAFVTTFIALKLYHDSGDIYLDRSRPGFLPEKEETEGVDDPADYTFSETGKLTREELEEYLTNLKAEINRLNDFSSEPFSPIPLSDETLGL